MRGNCVVRLLIVSLVCFCYSSSVVAQSITLSDCVKAAEENFPLEDQKIMQGEIGEALSKALWTAYIPQLSLGGQWTYQTHTTELDIELPKLPLVGEVNLDLPKIPKFQYNAYLEATQLIWDGGQVRAGSRLMAARVEVDQYTTDVEKRKVREGVFELYFSLLLLNQQEEVEQLLVNELKRQAKKVEMSLANGVATENDRDYVAVEMLKAEQRIAQINEGQKAVIEALSIFTGLSLSPDVRLVCPSVPLTPLASSERVAPLRAEHYVLDGQKKVADAEWSGYLAKGMPTLALFGRGGYGRPGLNLMDPEPSPYFIGGVTLRWNFGKLYDYSAQKRKHDGTSLILELKRQALEREIAADLAKRNGEVRQYQQLLESDKRIVDLQQQILDRNKLLREEGELSASDYLRHLNNYSIAKLTLETHRIQYVRAIFMERNSLGL